MLHSILKITIKQLKAPFAIYADFESLTAKVNSAQPNPENSFTEKYQHHQPCGFSYIVISDHEKYSKPPVVYCGKDAVDKFLECLEEEQKYIQEKLDFVEPMQIEREERAFQDAIHCHSCTDHIFMVYLALRVNKIFLETYCSQKLTAANQ